MQTSISISHQFIGNWHMKRFRTWNPEGVSGDSEPHKTFGGNKGEELK